MSSALNWISQITAVTTFGVRTIPQRKGAALTTAFGIAGVTTVFVGVMSIAVGLRGTLDSSGRDDVAFITRQGADTEMTSILVRDDVRTISDTAGIARDASGVLLSSELFVIINIPKRSTGTDANVPLRGVEGPAMEVRGNIEILEGRRFEPGKNEVIAGVGAAREFVGLKVGQKLRVGRSDWDVVGIFSAGGGVSESEIWTDAAVLQGAYQRGASYQSVQARLVSEEAFAAFKDALTTNPQVKVDVTRQKEFYSKQSGNVGIIAGIGVFIAFMMSLGALFGAINTMYSAVAARGREIATLRALGFGASPVVVSILVESLTIALIGGVVGAGVAYAAFNGYTAATMNFQTFSQVAFAFKVTPGLMITAVLIAAGIGFVGGILPAIRAARLPIASALRET
jgi:putative ABC transport system permease protein